MATEKPFVPRRRERLMPRRPSVLIGRTKKPMNVGPALTTTPKTITTSAEVAVGPSEDLERYRRGQITEAEYLHTRVELATTHLTGQISVKRLGILKEIIAQRLQTDPSLLEAMSRLLRHHMVQKNREMK